MAKAKFISQKGQQLPEMTEDQARAHLEKLRWPNGLVCIHCGSIQVYKLQGKSTRPGLIKCRDCKEQFTVSVGTIFEDSHLPLAKWIKAFHLMTSSKKGISALQLQRNLGLGSYKTAWHMAHRIRFAMKEGDASPMLKGTVEVDETYVGGKPRPGSGQTRKTGRGTSKTPVMALVERNGRSRAQVVERLDGATLREVMTGNIDQSARVCTDELPGYRKIASEFDGGHLSVNHRSGEYVNGEACTNTVESWFALLKRGVIGTFHQVSKQHLQRYCDEFAFRWDGRKMTDTERRTAALLQTEGKRLMFKQPAGDA